LIEAQNVKSPRIKISRRLSYTAVAILFVFIGLVVTVSLLAKYYLEKYDTALFGREATIGWSYANPFTGYVHLHDVNIYELQGDSIFISARSASANFSMRKLFSKQVWMEELTVDHPIANIYQKKDTLSFDDVIRKFTPGDSDRTPANNAWHVTLLDTRINSGEFHYYEKIIPINYFIKDFDLVGPGKTQDVDTISAQFSFEDGKGKGRMKGDFTINQKTLDYRFGVDVQAFDMEIIRQYIWELINYGMFHATLDAQVKATGNFRSAEDINAAGRLFLTDFHLGRTNEDAYIAFKKLSLAVDALNPSGNKFHFDSVTLQSPYFKYEVFDSLDNVQALFGKEGKNISDVTRQPGRFNLVIEIGRYLKDISRNFFTSDFRVGTLAVTDGTAVFNDYSTSEKFSISARPFSIRADSLYKNRERVGISLRSNIEPYGDANFRLSINPKDSGDFDLQYNIEKVSIAAFNPYLVTQTSFPLDRGTLELNGVWNVRNSRVKSKNHVVVIDPRTGKRIRNKDSKWIPMPLVMFLTRDRGNVMDFEIPITGDLKHPKFHVRDVILDVVKNIFVKPATTPYRMKVKELEKEIEQSLTLKWDINQRVPDRHQRKFLKHISEFLTSNPKASLLVTPIEYEAKEKEHILFYETKKKFYLISHNKKVKDFTKEDSLAVSEMSVKDDALVKHISRNLSDTVMFTIQEKCLNFVGHKVVDRSYNDLVKTRQQSFLEVFKEEGAEKQVKIRARKKEIPYNGFSFFRFEYPNGMEDKLREAFDEMRASDNKRPRKKYLKERMKSLSSQ
jgi:hypothetical protein